MVIEVKDCLGNDVCFGHLAKRWNPHMKDFILMKKDNIHIIDARKTVENIKVACEKIVEVVSKGEKILFVGTKRQFSDYIENIAREVSMPYVSYKWAGGMLTNFVTIRRIIKRIESIDKMIESPSFNLLPKKRKLIIKRDLGKRKRVFEGISGMFRMPGVVFVIDIMHENNAVREARLKQIPIIGIVDTNSDPTAVDFPIPANDDSFLSVKLIVEEIKHAILLGIEKRNDNNVTDLKPTKSNVEKKNETKGRIDKNVKKNEINNKSILISEKINKEKTVKKEKKKHNKEETETISVNAKNIAKELKNLKMKK